MKSFIALLVLGLSFQLLAQDSYHAEEITTCETSESCLISHSDHVIKLIPIENRRGEIVGERLSSESSIADVVYEKAQLCYQGNAQDVCKMLDLMSGGWHDHASITGFYCQIDQEIIHTGYRIEYDMAHETYFPEFFIKKCE